VLPNVEEIATVVVCEDDDPTRELLCDQLTADRYRALPAPSASDALRLCGYNHPDLMLLDLGLPDAPGIDVLREIRSSGERFDPELPVLVLSGRSSEADRLRGFEAGADDFLQKPFHYPELLARVSAVLRRRNGARRGPIQIGDLTVDEIDRGDQELMEDLRALIRANMSEEADRFATALATDSILPEDFNADGGPA
jgi:DNA-binding response OmpR family regulator